MACVRITRHRLLCMEAAHTRRVISCLQSLAAAAPGDITCMSRPFGASRRLELPTANDNEEMRNHSDER
jgi:hypothetical protein